MTPKNGREMNNKTIFFFNLFFFFKFFKGHSVNERIFSKYGQRSKARHHITIQ